MNRDHVGGSLSAAFFALLRRDLLLAFRRRTELLFPVIFLLVVISLFPLGIGPSPQLLARIAPGVIWIAALLATVISLDALFRSDFEDGTLEQFVISGHPLTLIALAKIVAHWLVAGLPIVLLSPLLALWMNLPIESLSVMIATLMLGTPILSLIGSIGVGLTISLKRGGQLLSLLVFPLYVPILIISTAAVMAASDSLPYTQFLGLLVAGLITSVTLAPFAAAAALKISLT
ncbi:MAG: heme exporter protein CcmB [Xanthomonadales bacterium]|jgi:heme exporter protein B|nr:heme exporter protein CcmB [Gammaproteobacteria bacterium]MBT8065367.1 heme exporter protein CcmB [Gammaproteobacteria bacterium]NNJ65043.1 heme exporter protein CcmB [Xanthomonadales bacterium]NNK37896.1 heme exporter protein CcmB [Xanthomonadales bacterium]